ncbi:MAG: VCBS repeat-containing protein, partial [Bdellovibrionales bacterium]|nr:VCBS repeat-containing protein [Bdellovibrionales bacterium]
MARVDRISISQFLSPTSSVNGLGRGASFDKAQNLSLKLDGVETAFSQSFLRINSAFESTQVTKDSLISVLGITDELIAIAEESAKKGTSKGRRKTLDRQFQSLIKDFKEVLSEAEKKGVDLLDVNDLTKLLEEAGLDTSNASELSQSLNRIAGMDDELGIEPIRTRPVTVTEKIKKKVTKTVRVGQTVDVGDGTFAAPKSSATGAGNVQFTALADFDGDGNPDLLQLSNSLDFALVSLGNGNGTFQAGFTLTLDGTGNSGGTFGDFDNDGNLDIATNNKTTGGVRIFHGNGDGNFNLGVDYAGSTNGAELESADVDGDGVLDLISANGTSNSVSVYLGNSNGTFSAETVTNFAGTVNDLTVDDMNGDGIADLNVSAGGSLKTLTGNSDGTFNAASFNFSISADDVQSLDLNNDGRLDLVAVDKSTDSARVFLGNGDGTYLAPSTVLLGDGPDQILFGDINGDGRTDLVTTLENDNAVTVSFGNSDGTFALGVSLYAYGPDPSALSLADLNNDGSIDIVATTPSETLVYLGNTQTVDLNDLIGSGTYTRSSVGGSAGSTPPPDPGSSLSLTPVQITDSAITTGLIATGFNVYQDDNGLGLQTIKIDNGSTVSTLTVTRDATLMTVNEETGYSVIKSTENFLGYNTANDEQLFLVDTTGTVVQQITENGVQTVGDGTFTSAQTNLDSFSSVVTGDFTGDGYADYITIATTGSTNSVRLYTGLGNGSFQSRITLTSNPLIDQIFVGDFDEDGKTDFMLRSSVFSGALLYSGNGDGTFLAPTTVAQGVSGIDDVGDFNNDGHIDILSDAGGGTISFGNGNGTFQAAGPVINTLSNAIVQDLDNDGNLDIVSSQTGGNQINVLYGNGDGTFSINTFTARSSWVTSLDLIDYDSDGNVDIAATDAFGGSLEVLFGNGNGTFAAGVTKLATSSFFTTVDFNQDGFDDYYNNNKTFLSNGDGTFSYIQSSIFAFNPQFVDLNNDGVKDVIGTGMSYVADSYNSFEFQDVAISS